MKHIVKSVLILSLLVHTTYAQRTEEVTMDEFRESFNTTTSRLRVVERDTDCYIGRPFREFVKHLEKQGVKIMHAQPIENMLVPIYVPEDQKSNGISLRFSDQRTRTFARRNRLNHPHIQMIFSNNLPSIEAWDLFRKYDGAFTEAVRTFYADAVIESIHIWIPDGMEQRR